MSRTLALSDFAVTELSKLPGVKVMPAKMPANKSDRTRLTVNVSGLGLTGFEADDILHQQLNITAELPALQTLTFIISLGNTQNDIQQLIAGFQALCAHHTKETILTTRLSEISSYTPTHTPLPTARSPRQIFHAPTQTLPTANAIGHICAETICPYPPGIPLLLPGEEITSEAIAHLQTLLGQGATLTGCQDKTLQTIVVAA